MASRPLWRSIAAWTLILASVPFAAAETPPNAADSPPVVIESSNEGRIFKWDVINKSAPPITRYEAPVFAVFLHKAPEGWTFESQTEDSFVAVASNPAYAIHAGQSGQFSARAMGYGGVLASGSVTIGFTQGDPMKIDHVWVPQVERSSTLLIPPAVIAGFALLFYLRSRRRARQRDVAE